MRSCYDIIGTCVLCGAPEGPHANDCPWPRLRELLDRSGTSPQ